MRTIPILAIAASSEKKWDGTDDIHGELWGCEKCMGKANKIGCVSVEQPWYTENWYMDDLENALESAEIEATEENLNKLLLGCQGIFDDKTARNEMLADKARELFREE